jgi:hypothetical protein
MSQVHFVGSRTRCDRGIVHITHGSGVLLIPERLQTTTIDVYRFLVGQTPPEYITIAEPQLNEHYAGQVETFGEDKVWVYQARPELSLDPPKWGRYVGPAMLLSAIAWFAAGIHHPVWVVMAVILLIFTPIIWMSGYRRPKPRLAQNDNSQLMGFLLFGLIGAVIMSNRQSKNSRELSIACLIISPAGIALSQGDLHGHMRWSELRNVKIRRGSSFSTPRIEVRIEGAKLNILDIYSSPLPDIHEQIEHYWKAG